MLHLISLTLTSEVGCSSSSIGFLSRDCLQGSATSVLQPLVIDASPLSSGLRYQLCVDLDGPGTLLAGPSNVIVYVSGVTHITPSFINGMQLQQQQVLLQCQDMACSGAVGLERPKKRSGSCSGLAESCENVSTWLPLSPGVNGSTFQVSSEGLVAGAHYKLCAEVADGAKMCFF